MSGEEMWSSRLWAPCGRSLQMPTLLSLRDPARHRDGRKPQLPFYSFPAYQGDIHALTGGSASRSMSSTAGDD